MPLWLPLFGVVVAIFVGAVIPLPGGSLAGTGPVGLVGLDKWAHTAAFGVFAGVLLGTLPRRGRHWLVLGLIVLLVTAAYGATIEGVQLAIPYRDFQLTDILADTVGGLVVIVGWRLLVTLRR